MKQKISLLLAFIMLLALTACGGGKEPAETVELTQAEKDQIYDWWEGDWYGWWTIFEGDGYYADQVNQSLDCCIRIERIDEEHHLITIWDEYYNSYSGDCLARVKVKIDPVTNKATSVMDADNYFYYGTVGSHGWVIDPKYAGTDGMLIIEGDFTDDQDDYCEYGVVMSQWGNEWVESESTYAPYHYYNYFQPLMAAGKDLPEIFLP